MNHRPNLNGCDPLAVKDRTALELLDPSTDGEPPIVVARAHHGELFQGVVEDPGRGLRRALVSLPCGLFESRASFHPDRRSAAVSIDTPWRVKALRAAELTLLHVGCGEIGGRLRVESNIPLRWGLGSSTSDVAAAIRAVAAAVSITLSMHEIAQLAFRAEQATDASMFGNDAVLFAHREGEVVEHFGRTFPELEVLGFNTDPMGYGVDTLALTPARYSWREIETFRVLMGMLRRAFHDHDPELLGRIATASARINQRFLPTPRFDSLESLARETEALGLQVAHSGTVVGLLFEPSQQGRISDAEHRLRALGFTKTWRFRVPDRASVA